MQAFKSSVKKNFGRWLYRYKLANQRKTELAFRNPKQVAVLPDAGFDIFTDQGEDGIIYYLLQSIEEAPAFFVDIGAGDCINSNCACLAVHFGWNGVFIDRNEQQLSIGKHFYQNRYGEIAFVRAEISPENVNELLVSAGVPNEIGLLSVDIDGNDYWIWKAIDCTRPRIVVIEAKVEFGYRNIVVPYGKTNHHSEHKMYNGASVAALQHLGMKKGYKLVGANKPGYNLFFVREEENLAAVDTASVLTDPATINSFYPDSFFSEHSFEKA